MRDDDGKAILSGRQSQAIAAKGMATMRVIQPAWNCPVGSGIVLLLMDCPEQASTLTSALAMAGITALVTTSSERNAAVRAATTVATVITGTALRELDLEAFEDAINDQPSWFDTMVIGVDVEHADIADKLARLDRLATIVVAGPKPDERLIVSLARAAIRGYYKKLQFSQCCKTSAPQESQPAEILDNSVGRCAAELGLEPTIYSIAGKPLNASDERNRAVIEMSDLILFTADAAGDVVQVDDRFYEITGFSRHKAMSITSEKDRVHPDDRERVRAAQRDSSRTGDVLNYDYRGLVADGSYRWWQFRAAPIFGAQGAILRWNGMMLDIHDRKVAEENLCKSEQRHRASIALSCLVTFTLDADGRLDDIDSHVCQLTGFSLPFLFANAPDDICHPDDRPLLARIRDELQHARSWDETIRVRHADGNYNWWRTRAAPRVDGDDKVIGWFGTLEHVHLLVTARERLKASEEIHRSSVELSDQVIWSAAADGTFATAGDGLFDRLGIARDAWMAMSNAERIHPDDLARAEALWDDKVYRDGAADFRYRLRYGDGSYRSWRFRAAPVRNDGGKIMHWRGMMEDVEELHQAGERLRESEERYRFAILTSNLITYTASIDGRVQSMDATAAAAAGFCVDQFVERGSDFCWHPDHLGYIKSARLEAAKTGRYDQTRLLDDGGGTYRWYRSRAAPFRDADGTILRWHGTIENVDDLKRAEEKLRESEDRHRFCIELSKLVTFTLTPDAVIESIDDTITAVTGSSAADIVGTLATSFCHPDDLAGLTIALLAAKDGGVFDHSYRFGDAAGGYRWWRSRAKLRRDDAGNDIRWYGTLEDIHDLRIAQEQLCESEELHRLSLKLSDMVLWTATPDGIVNDIGDRLFEVAGLTRKQMFGGRLSDRLHPDDVVRVLELRRRSLSEHAPADFDFRMQKADGHYHWWRWRSAPQYGDDGALIRWYGTLENIDSLRNVEEQLRASEQMHRHSIELSNLIVWTASAEGKFLTFSPRIFKRLGLTREMTKTLLAITLVHREDLPAATAAVQAGLQHGTLADIKLRLRHADGHYSWWRVRASPLRADDGSVVRWYGTLEDVDSATRGEQQLRQLQAEIAHMSRLNAMGAMASTLAHELNQPLAAVLNYIAGCRRLLANPSESSVEQIAMAMRRAEECALRAGEIIRRVRQQVLRGDSRHAVTTIESLIQDACAIALIDAHELSIAFEIDLEPAVAVVHVDRIQVQQVIINLLRNGVEAVTGRDDRKIVVSTRLLNGFCALAIDDTGPGVNDVMANRLFEPFESTKANGMGIGLSISRTIVESHGGKIEYERSSLGGARFTVLLPIGPPGG
jgi:PAS domain S-box-containing protein